MVVIKIVRHCSIVIFAFACSCVLPGCLNTSNNTGRVTKARSFPKVIERAKKDKWYIMLHSGMNAYTVHSVELDKAKKEMTVQLDKPDSLHVFYIKNPATKPYKAIPTLSEIHVYMKDSISYTLDEPHTLLMANVASIEMLEP
ncbi:MAG: hypothetical protein WKF97_20785 [Chitinophagaceae bacterium]